MPTTMYTRARINQAVYRRLRNFRGRNISSLKFSRNLIFEGGYPLENLNTVKICFTHAKMESCSFTRGFTSSLAFAQLYLARLEATVGNT